MRSTRSAVIWSPKPAMCRYAASWCRDRSRSKRKCSTPIRGESSACESTCARTGALPRRANCRRRQKSRRSGRQRRARRAPGRTRTRRGHRDEAGSCHCAVLGMAAPTDRVHGRRAFGAGNGTFQCLAGLVSDVPDAGLADRRCGDRPLGRSGRRGGDRLVVRLRLFCRRSLLDRLRVFGRCAGLRLAVADRGHRSTGGACHLHRVSASRWPELCGLVALCAFWLWPQH